MADKPVLLGSLSAPDIQRMGEHMTRYNSHKNAGDELAARGRHPATDSRNRAFYQQAATTERNKGTSEWYAAKKISKNAEFGGVLPSSRTAQFDAGRLNMEWN